jgi:signal transduction histidine kinase
MTIDSISANRRILVIDDNESIHQDFRKILNPSTPGRSALASAAAELFGSTAAGRPEAQFEIDSAFQGQEGLEMVREACEDKRPYAMAFVDVRMPPGWDGIETIRRIWEEYPDLQVVVCTAYSDYSLDQIISSLGRTDRLLILKKPFDAIEVLQLADALTEKWRLALDARLRMETLESRVAERTRELREGQKQLIEARKMELVGKLAGGIAHDFNTIFTAIIGHADLIRQVVPPGDLPFRSAIEIGKSAQAAAKLTHQILAFSRRQMLKPERLDINAAVRNSQPALLAVLGDAIALKIQTASSDPWTCADASQIQEVLISLAHNARDAMPHGGSLTVETANADCPACASCEKEIGLRDYVAITITDTGVGIPEEVMQHIFEPYFTTKARAAGKGLGLAMCHGILKQSGGHISISSEVGIGTTVQIYLPRFREDSIEKPAMIAPRSEPAQFGRGTGVILLVEENPGLRGVAATVLQNQGYVVRLAGNSREAMSIAGRLDRIDLLLTDAILPDMTGHDLAEWLSSSRPGMKLLIASPSEENTGDLGPEPAATFLRKPYTPETLTRKVHAAMAGDVP